MKIFALILYAVFNFTSNHWLLAQRADSTTINYKIQQNKASFNATLRPLRQVAGAPSPFYTYFWELGDGAFSFNEQPEHRYADTGTYQVQLFATNNYDDGKPPPIRRKPVKISSDIAAVSADKKPSFFGQNGSLEMKVNRMPRPDEDMVLIIGYRNPLKEAVLNGSLLLFYNQKEFKNDNFILADARAYHGEKQSSVKEMLALHNTREIIPLAFSEKPATAGTHFSWRGSSHHAGLDDHEEAVFFDNPGTPLLSQLVKEQETMYRQSNAWRFNGVKPMDEHYFFLTLHTTPEMLKDTNAVVSLTGLFVPDDTGADIEQVNLEMQIVSSHDPNRMMLKNRRLNYRFTGQNKENNYKVVFNNVGKGPTKNVRVSIAVPAGMKNSSLEIVEMKPKCPWCKNVQPGQSCVDTLIGKNSILVLFKNIYLPGLNQAFVNDPDSSMGFVKYRLRFDKKELKKLPFESRASIVFDKNEPIFTNTAKGVFIPGKSLGIIAGYSRSASHWDNKNFAEGQGILGLSLSPFAPYRKYLQVELLAGYRADKELLSGFNTLRDTIIGGSFYRGLQKEIYSRPKIISLELVPAELRYNFDHWIGTGIGSTVYVDALTIIKSRETAHYLKQEGNNMLTPFVISKDRGTTSAWFKNWDVSVFADVQLGMVRTGPAIGARFLHYFINTRNRLFFYATWRL